MTAWYQYWWTRAATAAGVRPTATRRVSPHGLRRGLATAAALAGVPVTEIQAELRHDSWVVTLRYTDDEHIDMDAVAELLELTDERTAIDPATVAHLAATQPDGGPDDGRCVIVDDHQARCTRPAHGHHPDWGQVCALHVARIRRGIGVTRPVPAVETPDDGADDDREEPTHGWLNADRCAAAGCPAAPLWWRSVSTQEVMWLCQHHARAHALDPNGAWQALRVCDGLGCDRTYSQHRDGEPQALIATTVAGSTLTLCLRCWTAARNANDPTDRMSWAPRPRLPRTCQLCEGEWRAVAWVTDDGHLVAACGPHWNRWKRAGRPSRLPDQVRAPIGARRRPDAVCALCDDGTWAAGRLPDGAGQIPACNAHMTRWRAAGKPATLPDHVRGPIRR